MQDSDLPTSPGPETAAAAAAAGLPLGEVELGAKRVDAADVAQLSFRVLSRPAPLLPAATPPTASERRALVASVKSSLAAAAPPSGGARALTPPTKAQEEATLRDGQSHRIRVLQRLLEVMSSQGDVDYPLCEAHAVEVKNRLAARVAAARADIERYRDYIQQHEGEAAAALPVDEARMAAELAELRQEEARLMAEAREVDAGMRKLDEEQKRLEEEKAMEEGEPVLEG